ncbi:13643_t:CDS:2 [Gigaspora rosea]|nr:13643_t:CDS:2 [Gigaspora rosea]
MTKFEDPNKDKTITSTILPPRVISVTVLPPRNAFATTSNPEIAGTSTGNNTVFASNAEIQSWISAKGYNPKTFNYNPPHARFFIIKSCTGDDIHKSIKAFCDNADKGPIYLFFSIIARSSILDKFEFYDKREVEMRKDKIALLRPANPGVVTTNH